MTDAINWGDFLAGALCMAGLMVLAPVVVIWLFAALTRRNERIYSEIIRRGQFPNLQNLPADHLPSGAGGVHQSQNRDGSCP